MDVLEDLSTANKITFIGCIPFRIVISYKRNPLSNLTTELPTLISWIKTYSSVVSELAEQPQKISLATPDLNNFLIMNVIALD